MGKLAPLILASASPRRLELLSLIGVCPDEIIPADIDETPHKLTSGKTEAVRPYVARMAIEKAQAIAKDRHDAFVLAGDTVVSVGTRILQKAQSRDEERYCLSLISGRSHRVYSGVCVIAQGGKPHHRVVESRVKVRHLSDQHIEDYIDSAEWEGKAGGYAIQGLFSKHIISIIGSYPNIVGLPLYETNNLLVGAGWKQN